jgi:hypothetical protein
MGRFMLKSLLGLSLLAGLAVLFAGHQLYLWQLVSRGESQGERLLIGPVVVQLESLLGKEATLDPQTVKTAWLAGGIPAGVGFLGLFVLGLRDSSRAKKAARQVAPPSFDDRDLVASYHFYADGLRYWTTLYRILAIPLLLFALLLLLGIYPAITHQQWVASLILLAAAGAFAFTGVAFLKKANNPLPRHGVERIDIMLGGLRWIRLDDPSVRTVAWSQIGDCQSHHNLTQQWKNQTVVTLRTGEKIWLWACCLTNYDDCVNRVEQGRKNGRLTTQYAGNAGLATAFRFNR